MRSHSELVLVQTPQGNALWIHSAAFRSAGRIALTKSPSWWLFWHQIVRPRSPEANTSSTAEQFRRSKLRLLAFSGNDRRSGESFFAAAGDAKISEVDVRDVAAVAAA